MSEKLVSREFGCGGCGHHLTVMIGVRDDESPVEKAVRCNKCRCVVKVVTKGRYVTIVSKR